MLRYWLRLSPLLLLCITIVLLFTATLPRFVSVGAVLEYQRFWPSAEVIWANYTDVDHGLTLSFEQFMIVAPVKATDTAQDGRLVRSLPTPGNVDLFLAQPSGSETRLTRSGNFPPDRFGADARRSNLFPRWSADDTWIAFLSVDPAGKTDLYVVRPDGSGLHMVGERTLKQIPLRPRWVNLNGLDSAPNWALLAVLGIAGLGSGTFYRLRWTP